MKKILRATFFIYIGLVTSVNATLIDRSGGLIYDNDLNITWLQDANYANTTGYDDDLYHYNTNGLMTWADAVNWADNLMYGGYANWRLPTTLQPDISCNDQGVYNGISITYGLNCTGGELGHLFYGELGGIADSTIYSSTDPDRSLFINLNAFYYWSGTEFAPRPADAWFFDFANGRQDATNGGGFFRPWPVRDGDVSRPVPEPCTLLLVSSGLIGLFIWKVKTLQSIR